MGFFASIFGKDEEPAPVQLTLDDLDENHMIEYKGEHWVVSKVVEFETSVGNIKDILAENPEGTQLNLQYNRTNHRWNTYRIESKNKFDPELITAIAEDRHPLELKHGEVYFFNEEGTGKLGDLEYLFWQSVNKQDSSFIRFEQYGDNDFSCLVGEIIDPLTITFIGDTTDDD